MYKNSRPMTTAGKSQVTTGIKIHGKNEAAYEPVIIVFPFVIESVLIKILLVIIALCLP